MTRRMRIVLASAAVLLVLGGAGLAIASVWRVRADATADEQTFTVSGYLQLYYGDYTSAGTNTNCSGKGGYDDIHAGAQVRITDASGTVIAVSKLDQGWNDGRDCTFGFTVEAVPRGHDFYGVEVSHRGALTYDSERIRKRLELSLG